MSTLFHGISQLVTGNLTNGTLEVVDNAALVVDETGHVTWLGPYDPRAPVQQTVARIDCKGRAVLPGFVECHTHLVFGGDRTRDFAERCSGVTYEAIAARGGGIQTTVDATRAASADSLVALGVERCGELMRHGVTTVEIKTGYGLSFDDEIKLLEVIERIDKAVPQRVVATCLAAHVVPREWRHDRAGYVAMVCDRLLVEVKARGLASFVDVFCEHGAFSLAEGRRIFEVARRLGLGVKVHAEQLSRTGAASLAAEFEAASADHLEFIQRQDAQAMAASNTVAVLLPGAALFLGGGTRPPVELLREAGVPMALSTDMNPGTSPTTHLPLMTTLGCAWLGLTPDEAIAAITTRAAAALSLGRHAGGLWEGARADFVVSRWSDWRRIPYEMGAQSVNQVWIGGRKVSEA